MVKMKKIKNTLFTVHFSLLALLFTSCEKVSPIGVLVSGTGVEDRVKMSHLYFKEHKSDYKWIDASDAGDEYTFLVGADSHMTDDRGRMSEMLQNGLDHDDVLYAHLGDIADTKAEYYINLERTIETYKELYAKKYYKEVNLLDTLKTMDLTEEERASLDGEDSDDYILYEDEDGETYKLGEIQYPFFPVVGNHDITHNGWALWSNIFHSSFYDVWVLVGDIGEETIWDHFIFLDTANGTLGKEQVDLIEQGLLDDKYEEQFGVRTRNTFVFSHTNIFRPSSLQFASTFAREESFFLLNQFVEWKANIVFCGHVHKWDEQEVGGVHYLTLDSMSENNNPEPGDYLVRVHVKRDGTLRWEQVRMNYTKK